MKMKIASFIALLVLVGFLFIMVIPSNSGPSDYGWAIHPVGDIPLSNSNVFEDPKGSRTDHVNCIDDYFLRNGQVETGSNNIVTSIVFDYRGFDTLGEGTVLFIAVSSISMLLYHLLKKKDNNLVPQVSGFNPNTSMIISYTGFLLVPLIMIFGAYLVVHGHLSPGGGFQGGAVAASGTALLLIATLITRNSYRFRKILSTFESVALTTIVVFGLVGIGVSFLFNFLATPDGVMNTVPLGFTGGDLTSAGTLPFLSLAVGIEVFCGLSIILVSFFNLARDNSQKKV